MSGKGEDDMSVRGPLLSIRGLTAAFRQEAGLKEVVRDVHADLFPEETLALVGESGSGKTVTAASVLRLIPSVNIEYPSGEVLFRLRNAETVNTLSASERELMRVRGEEIGMIFQEPMSSLNPLHTVEKQIAETLSLHRGWSLEQSRPQVRDWLHRVGIRRPEEQSKSYPHQLSGGERQRVMIAMALINEPALLIADEPTTSLDVTIQAQILDLLQELKEEMGLAVLFITHDLSIVRRIADRVAVMREGRIVEIGGTEELFRSPKDEYTRDLIASEPTDPPKVPAGSVPEVLRLKDLKVWFPIQRGFLRTTRGYVKAVDGVSLTLRKGQTLGVVGESGSGKTTLGKAVLRLERSEGKIYFGDVPVHGLSEKEMRPLRRSMQVIFQDPYGSLSPRLTVEGIIGEGLEVHSLADKEEREGLIVAAMEEVGLDPEARHRYPNEFSGGQRQRIALARALVLKPDFLVLDEPTSSLDRSIQFQVIELLKGLQEKYNLTYLFISHDLKVVKSLAHELVIMRAGKIVEQGPAEKIFLAPREEYTRELLSTAFA